MGFSWTAISHHRPWLSGERPWVLVGEIVAPTFFGDTALRWHAVILVIIFIATGCSKPVDLGVGPFQGQWKGPGPANSNFLANFDKDLVQILETSPTGANLLAKGAFRVNPPGKSGEIDIVETGGVNVGKTHLGIFAFEDGKTLKICLADLDNPRPTDFVAREGYTLLVLTCAE
jgi:uncharacterized protein (TIGR03067 family)